MKKHEAEVIAGLQADEAGELCRREPAFNWEDRAIARASAFCGALGALDAAGVIDDE